MKGKMQYMLEKLQSLWKFFQSNIDHSPAQITNHECEAEQYV
jgi:hypothetical protein